MSEIEKRTDNIRALLGKMQGEMEKVLFKTITPDRMLRLSLTEFKKNKKLLECTESSICASVLGAAQLNLEPGNGMGQVYFVPYKQECTLQIGYRGMITLALRSQLVKMVEASYVKKLDKLEIIKGTSRQIIHVPNYSQESETIGAYSIAFQSRDLFQFDYMPLSEIVAVMRKSKGWKYAEEQGKKDSMWHLHFDEMAKKTPTRRNFKYLPAEIMPSLAHEFIAQEDEYFGAVDTKAVRMEAATTESAKGLAARLDKATGKVAPETAYFDDKEDAPVKQASEMTHAELDALVEKRDAERVPGELPF